MTFERNLREIADISILSDELDMDRPLLLCGFPGIGLIGNIAIGHLIQELGMKKVGVIQSKYFPPVIFLKNGIVNIPVRIYTSKETGMVAIISDIPIEPRLSYGLSIIILDWAEQMGVSEVVSIAGIATPGVENKVFGVATDGIHLDRIKGSLEVFDVGTISGISGSILSECTIRGIPAFGFLGETHGTNPDPRASAAVIEVLNKIYQLDVSITPLLEEAEAIEFNLQGLAQQVERTGIETRPKNEFSMLYG